LYRTIYLAGFEKHAGCRAGLIMQLAYLLSESSTAEFDEAWEYQRTANTQQDVRRPSPRH